MKKANPFQHLLGKEIEVIFPIGTETHFVKAIYYEKGISTECIDSSWDLPGRICLNKDIHSSVLNYDEAFLLLVSQLEAGVVFVADYIEACLISRRYSIDDRAAPCPFE